MSPSGVLEHGAAQYGCACKDHLGGNSKTVMVATISPASDNFEATLSTRRHGRSQSLPDPCCAG